MKIRELLAVALTVIVLCIAGCSSSSAPSPKPTSATQSAQASNPSAQDTSPPATKSTASTASVEQAIEAAWSKYWRVGIKLEVIPPAKLAGAVASVAVEPIYGQLLNAGRAERKAGLVGYGYVKFRPTWPSPPAATATKAVMTDCFDGSHAGSKVASTGKIQTVGKPRTNVQVNFIRGNDRVWRVHQIEYLKASC